MLKPWLELARISILPTAWTNVLAGWLLAGGRLNDHRLLWLLLGGSLLYSGGMILNDAADARWDCEHRKERPIPRGDVSVGAAWCAGLMLMLVGGTCMAPLGGASLPVVACLALCILAYDLYHKQWTGSVFVMGACRTLLYLAAGSAALGASAATSTMAFSDQTKNLWLGAVAIGLYIVGLTKIARFEALGNRARVRRFVFQPFLIFTPAVAAVFVYGGHRDGRVLAIVVIFIIMTLAAIRIMRQGGPSIGRAVGILLAGIAVVDGLAVASVSFPLACGFVALAPLLRLWQRWIAAT